FQLALCDDEGRAVAIGNTVPLVWDGTAEGLAADLVEILERAIQGAEQGRAPTALSALAAIVTPDWQRQGLSRRLLELMKDLAAEHGLGSLIAPVRPTLKAAYPLTPMERYAAWRRSDGAPFD